MEVSFSIHYFHSTISVTRLTYVRGQKVHSVIKASNLSQTFFMTYYLYLVMVPSLIWPHIRKAAIFNGGRLLVGFIFCRPIDTKFAQSM